MHISVSRSARRLALPLAVAALAAPSAATAAPATADLHVEAAGKALVPGYSYKTDTTSITTDRRQPACGGSGARKTVQNPTALGSLIDASSSRAALRPLGVSDKFSFGLLVCGVGQFLASDTAFWLYKVNHVAPEVGGDQFRVKNGDDVLWYLSDSSKNQNTGDELVVQAPVRVKAGAPIQVRVAAFSFDGKSTPAAGARVSFGQNAVVTDATGVATARAGDAGTIVFRAGRGADIPSTPVKTCVGASLSDCSPVRGKRLFGSPRADRLSGGGGPDAIDSGAGRDRIDVRGGRRDRVRCGAGRDRVRLDRNDSARGCEIVLRTRRRS
jgi:Ca2+-binding RTX toxin-like protein